MQKSNNAIIALIGVTVIWGLTFPLIKNAVVDIDPSAFVALRMLMATLVMLPFVIHRFHKTTVFMLLGGLVVGVLSSAIYITQSIGLETTSSANSAFITASSVILVPFLSPLFGTGRPRFIDIVVALITLLGIFILTGASLSHLTVGDYWTLGCALTYTLFIITLQRITQKSLDLFLLVFYQILFAVPIPLAVSFYKHAHFVLNESVIVAVLFCSIFATCFTFYIQNAFQKYTTVTKAALIYTFEPVFASIFAVYINGERITHYTEIGGLLVLIGFLCAECLPRLKIRSLGKTASH
ncbi:DMT family transporter [Candidiatus Paracoxiella cheracis]|uniref:DMT family transporter n=1 Tax=Candidiatus Paracoxiella cheracis TaxID=3405120 RepID=UPI003BF5F061